MPTATARSSRNDHYGGGGHTARRRAVRSWGDVCPSAIASEGRPKIATAASEEQRVTDNDTTSGADQTSDDVSVETTSVFRSDFLNELDPATTTGNETAASKDYPRAQPCS
jgi:hypothetical protein